MHLGHHAHAPNPPTHAHIVPLPQPTRWLTWALLHQSFAHLLVNALLLVLLGWQARERSQTLRWAEYNRCARLPLNALLPAPQG